MDKITWQLAKVITIDESATMNKRAATIAWQLAMEHNKVAEIMASTGKLARTDYPEAKKQLFRFFYLEVLPSCGTNLSGDTEEPFFEEMGPLPSFEEFQHGVEELGKQVNPGLEAIRRNSR